MRNARDDDGFVLITAILVLTVMMGLGLGLIFYTNSQQKAAGREQASESAFNVAEAALNAQVGQVSRAWPGTKKFEESEIYPKTGCTAASSTTTNGCPTAESLKVGYPSSSTTCPVGSPKDAWGSPLTNEWTTYARDDVTVTEGGKQVVQPFNSTTEQGLSAWDANGDGKVWVRSVGVVQCRMVVLTTLVSQQFVAASFPQNAMTGNWFETGNHGGGSGSIVNTRGKASQNGKVSMRCAGYTGTEAEIKKNCEKYVTGQIEPDTTEPRVASPSPTFSSAQLATFKQQAEWAGTYYPTGRCPSGMPAGAIVYVEGPCAVGGGGNEKTNSEASPGFLIIANGTFSMGGTSVFYGVVYAVNQQESSVPPPACSISVPNSCIVVSIGGNAKLHGAIDVDGNGGIEVGESHKENLEFNPEAIEKLKLYAGATPTRNSFRVLPNSQ